MATSFIWFDTLGCFVYVSMWKDRSIYPLFLQAQRNLSRESLRLCRMLRNTCCSVFGSGGGGHLVLQFFREDFWKLVHTFGILSECIYLPNVIIIQAFSFIVFISLLPLIFLFYVTLRVFFLLWIKRLFWAILSFNTYHLTNDSVLFHCYLVQSIVFNCTSYLYIFNFFFF